MKPEHYPQEPAHLWEHFYQITQTPRPSGAEAELRQKIIGLATAEGNEWACDEQGNLVVYVPGTHGMERADPVLVQNHLDMVTVKTDDSDHDFSKDPLRLLLEDGWLHADRTTLGADNGLGCAAALALMTDEHVVHPPLELLFTVEEETGLFGASELDASLLKARRMLNLDTEDWGEIFIGCAGGRDWELRRQLHSELPPPGWQGRSLQLRGLGGGHSGIQIHQQLGNAIKLLAEWLQEAESLGVRVSAFHGGVAHNVIPREASIEFFIEPAAAGPLDNLNRMLLAQWREWLPADDAGLSLELRESSPASVLDSHSQSLVKNLVTALPHGAQRYSLQQPAELVDLSINLACLRADSDGLFVETSMRYFNEAESRSLQQQVYTLAEVFGCEIQQTIDYPGWQPEFNNPLLELTVGLYRELFQEQLHIKAIHAGLECGILKSKKADLDIVSFGPTIRGAHSPTERLEVATVMPFWQLLTGLLKRL